MVTRDNLTTWLENFAKRIEKNKAYLTMLDSKIGDADHGINMNRGMSKVVEKLSDLAGQQIDGALKQVGMTLVSTVGGASGPLYGTFFMRAGSALGGREELNTADLADLFEAGLQGIKDRGKAELGQKTMVDAMQPALEALQQAAEEGVDTEEALKRATDAAYQGMKDTIPLVAQKGRASYLGERSKGHQDPGSTSTYLLFEALYDVVTDEDIEKVMDEAEDIDMEAVEEDKKK